MAERHPSCSLIPMALNDPYLTLGVEKTAKQDDIRNAYRKLAKKHHPDLNPGSKAAEAKFKDISLAYERVGTAEARAKFDRGEFDIPTGQPGPSENPFGRGGPSYSRTQSSAEGPGGRYSHSFTDGFDEDLFAGFAFPQEDEVYQMDIELAESILGGEREISLPTGKRLRVKIPAGVAEGSRLRFAGQGAPGRRGRKAADVYVELHIRPDPRFEVSGTDLISHLSVSVIDAVFGGEVRTPTVDGGVMLKIPPHSNSRKRLKLRGKGLFDRVTKTRGDQIVVLEIMLPEPADAGFEAALKQWQSQTKEGANESR
jgi:DnaJ-class molecular chaperone